MRTTILTLTAVILLTTTAAAQNTLEVVWIGYGEGPLNYYGAGATGGDFNNDGFSDVLIGAGGWGNIGGNDAIGKDYLYLGSPDFFDTASYFFTGDTASDGFDWDVCNVSDVSGDQIQDFLIPGAGAAYYRGGGYVDIFYGGPQLDTIPDFQIKKHNVSGEDFFGWQADSAGDVNGDGWSDVVVSGVIYDINSAYIEIYFGGPNLDTLADWHYSSLGTNQPIKVNGLGDVNGDGFDDILAYRQYGIYPEHEPGKIFFGGSPMDTIPDLEFYPYALSAAGVGDVNDDGFSDVAIGDWDQGQRIYFGGVNMDTIPDVALQGYFGPSIAGSDGLTCGDFNGDGISDIIADGDYGGIVLYLGSPWFNGVPEWWYSEFWMVLDGITVNGVGDVNGDGCDEFVLGFPYYDNMSWMNVGKAYLFAGNPDLVDLGAPVEPGELSHIPGWYKLDQNFPNPFNASTTIHFELGKLSTVNMTIFDLAGNKIRELIKSQEMRPGGYNVSWSGRNQFNQPISSGIYILELQVDQFKETRKMVLIR
ncbi:MAG TPA: T9SS type A sorting domain-containing protein [Bacteroidetes bacterium]|nr:T9SS type A sorting domain-containing protein [Bacteroidota bacterium]